MSQAPSDTALFRKAWPYLRPSLGVFLLGAACAPASALLTIAQPWLLKRAIDDYIVPGDLPGLQAVAFAFLGAVTLALAMEVAYTLAMAHASFGSIARLRDAVYDHTLRMSQSFFDTRPTGRLLTRVTSDVEALGETLTAGAITIVLDALLVLGVLVAMFAMDARLTLILLLFAPLIGFVLDRIRRVLRRLYLEVRTSLSALNAFTAERLNGLEVVQLYNDEARTLREYRQLVGRYRDATVRTNVWDALIYAIMDGLSSVVVAVLLGYGASQSLGGALTAGTLVAFIDYTGKLFRPIQEFSSKLAVLQRASAALEKIFGLLDHDERIPGSAPLPRPVSGRLVLEDLRFGYRDGPRVLDGVSLTVEPGSVVAVVGRTGSGKSTLAKLITRAYDGYTGSLTLDGAELRDLDPQEVRRALGMVRQDVHLFPGTVRDNLALGAELTDDELLEAVRLTHAEAAVERLGGLDGAVGHGGNNLSVGEAQLLSFARTMAHDPPLVVLDEATASVDSLTEARIQAATDAVLAAKTVLVIAHRLSTIVHADCIVVLDAGRVVEAGTHAELLARAGTYAHLFAQQFAEPSVASGSP